MSVNKKTGCRDDEEDSGSERGCEDQHDSWKEPGSERGCRDSTRLSSLYPHQLQRPWCILDFVGSCMHIVHINSVRCIHKIERLLKKSYVLEFENCLLFLLPTLIEKKYCKLCCVCLWTSKISKIYSGVFLYNVSVSVTVRLIVQELLGSYFLYLKI